MKEIEIKKILQKNKINVANHGSIYATIIASVGAYNNGIGNIMHTMKDHILHFNNEGIAIVAINDMNGTILEDTFVYISADTIKSINIKIKFLKFILTIRTDKGDVLYKVRKSILASPWHKENLSNILLKFSIH